MKMHIVLVACFFIGTFATLAVEPPSQLIAAMICHESSNGKKRIGDLDKQDKAYGCLQIRRLAVVDVNRKYGTTYRSIDCMDDRNLSIWICKKYIDKWATPDRLGRQPTMEDMARIWNGGPDGWKSPLTKDYWPLVRQYIK